MLTKLWHRLSPRLRQFQRNHSENSRISYAQCGEDLILEQLFMALGISKVTYLDVGAHHPTYLSNTFLLYEKGGCGVCVEPDPALYAAFKKKRPRDTHLNCGVGIVAGEADFFVMSTATLNTFSREDAQRYQSYGQHRCTKTIQVRLESINEIIRKHFDAPPNLLSLDIEGLDYTILQTFKFDECRPQVFCLETLSYTEDKSEQKLMEISELMHANGYMTYADTFINTIFVDISAWKNRPC